MKHSLTITIAMVLCFGLTVTRAPQVHALTTPSPHLMISELQTGGLTENGTSNGRDEFIELYNATETNLDVTGWHLEYLSAAHNGTGSPTRTLVTLQGQVLPKQFMLVASQPASLDSVDHLLPDTTVVSGYLAQGGGHVRIVDALGKTIDLVTWGGGVAIEAWWNAPEIPYGQSIQRILPGSAAYTDGAAFAPPNTTVSPQGGGLVPVVSPPQECGLVLSELFPNPKGSDKGREFIEVYNPTSTAQQLQSCSIRIGEKPKIYALPDMVVEPNMYYAIFNTDIDFNLANDAAETVWLIGPTTEEGVRYADALLDDHTWAFIAGVWQETAQQTANQPNVASLPPEPETVVPPPKPVLVQPCGAGKERNPDTGRCRAASVPNAPVACGLGKERNPDTQRCRDLRDAGIAPVPCKEGQTRNADTGRCRSVLAAETSPSPCAAGQVRNPDTNRCRKMPPSTAAISKVEDVASKTSRTNMHWIVIGITALSVLGYALYEWRNDIANVLHKVRNKSSQKPRNWNSTREKRTIKDK